MLSARGGPDDAPAPRAPRLDPAALFARWRGARGVLLAVSGGPDSIALMLLAAGWREAGAPPLAVAVVDHGLRAGSAAEAETVCDAARSRGFPAALLRWEGPKPATRIQERARAARYALLCAEARRIGADAIMTAHHADDQAETVLMRLLAGSGITGLAGMAEETTREGLVLARPLLGLRKRELVALCRAAGCGFVDDPSNVDPRFARARLRTQMAALGLDAPALLRLAARAARADAALEAAAAALPCETRPDGTRRLDRAALAAAPAETRARALRRAVLALAPAPDAPPLRLERLEALEARLAAALAADAPFAATLGGAALRLTATALELRPAPPRNRGFTAARAVPWQHSDTHLNTIEPIRPAEAGPRRAGRQGAKARQERE